MTVTTQRQLGERLRQARLRAGLRQADLARAANISSTALNRLEAGAGSSVQTLTRVCACLGIELLNELASMDGSRRRAQRPPGRRLTEARAEDRRAYELHREVVRQLRTDPKRVLTIAQRNLERMGARPRNPLAEQWLAEWAKAVRTGPEALETLALRTDERGNDLRQVSPFAGVLSEFERQRALERAV